MSTSLFLAAGTSLATGLGSLFFPFVNRILIPLSSTGPATEVLAAHGFRLFPGPLVTHRVHPPLALGEYRLAKVSDTQMVVDVRTNLYRTLRDGPIKLPNAQEVETLWDLSHKAIFRDLGTALK